jgi:cytochrome P450
MDRQVPINLAFSTGPHRCIGAHVARLEMMMALEAILSRLPDLTLAPGQQPDYSNSGVARSLDRIPLVFAPREGVGDRR